MNDVPKHKKQPKVLVVDDVPENIQLVVDSLQDLDLDVSFASNGLQALKTAQHFLPDLILLDIMMPEMGGYEVCQRLKAHDSTKEIPVIFLTAKYDKSDIVTGFRLGAVDYITKPFNTDELLARVNTHLDLRQKTLELRSVNQTLEQKVKERTSQLEEANRQLKLLDKAKSDFLILINHELRTPLNGIVGSLDLLNMMVEDEQQRQLLDITQRSSDRLVYLTELALLITSLRSKEYELMNMPVAVSSLIDDLIDKLEHKSPKLLKEQLTIEHQIDDRSLQLFIDQHLMENCIGIILGNAIEHSPPKGLIQIISKQKDQYIVVEIYDEGPGFTEGTMQQLFRFFEAKNIAHHAGGFGLGLATAKLIMETLGGHIELNNRPERGAVIRLYFAND